MAQNYPNINPEVVGMNVQYAWDDGTAPLTVNVQVEVELREPANPQVTRDEQVTVVFNVEDQTSARFSKIVRESNRRPEERMLQSSEFPLELFAAIPPAEKAVESVPHIRQVYPTQEPVSRLTSSRDTK